MKKGKLSERAAEYIVALKDEALAALRVETIAAHLSVNPSYLSRKFRSDTEMTLNEFITGVKMRRVALLLSKNSDIPIVTLAKQTGFARADYFVLLFKNHFGIHPKKYGELRKKRYRSHQYN